MDQEALKQFIDQCLAMANNYLCTGRINKAIEVTAQVNKIDPGNEVAKAIMHAMLDSGLEGLGETTSEPRREAFGVHWRGEPLDGKSIEIFCDQGMGDTINCLRYVKMMKDRWDCRIVLNYYAYYDVMARLMRQVGFVDEFTKSHVRCDYNTNILSIPARLNNLHFDVYYPAHWQALLDTEIPPPTDFGWFPKPVQFCEPAFRVGIANHSNMDNELGQKKSVSIGVFAMLEDGVNELYSILPDTERVNMMVQLPLEDLFDTASYLTHLDAVVTVDTVTLHLAGSMGKKTLALLPHEADARWGLGVNTVWYPTVELFRQTPERDWEPAMRQIKDRLVSLRSMV